MWYPLDKKELEELLGKLVKKSSFPASPNLQIEATSQKINGIIVPHAGYIFSGEVAGKAYSLLNAKKVLILAPNHYMRFRGILAHNEKYWQTPLGKIKVIESDFSKADLKQEHSLDNQVPFLQKIGAEEVLPLSVGEISLKEAKDIANKIKDFDGKIVVSTDLSHFNNEEKANLLDKKTMEIIENLDIENSDKIDACGIYPLLVLIELCKIKKWKPKLVEYKTSGSLTGDFSSVVGYASFVF